MSRKRDQVGWLLAGTALLLALLLALTPAGRRLAVAALTPLAEMGAAGLRSALRIVPGAAGKSRRDELAELRERVAALTAVLAEAEDLKRQNATLRAMLHQEPPVDWEAVAAQVIGRDPLLGGDQMTINRGFADGVVTGAAVLSEGVIFGRVLHSERHSATIVALTSAQCQFGVALSATGQRPRQEGILQGGGGRWFGTQHGFTVDCLPPILAVSPDEIVYSSGLGGWMPDGVPAGRVIADADGGGALHVIDTARGQLHCHPCYTDPLPHFVVVLKPATAR